MDNKLSADDSTVDASGPIPYKPKSAVIPLGPCHVCGANSSGYHFGVISCEACKSFFRRTIKLSLKYTCLQDQSAQCPLRQIKGEKPPCPACRLNKCLELGMAVQAIKRGRYSHAKRVESFHTAKHLADPNFSNVFEDSRKIKPESYSSSEHVIEPNIPSTSNTQNSVKTSVKQGNATFTNGFKVSDPNTRNNVGKHCLNCEAVPLPKGLNPHPNHCFPPAGRSEKHSSDALKSKTILKSQNKTQPLNLTSHNGQLGPENSRTASSKRCFNLKGIIKSVQNKGNTIQDHRTDLDGSSFPLSCLRGDSDMENMMEQILATYDRQNFATFGFTAKVPSVIHSYLVAKQKEFPKQKPMSREEHRRIFRETGEDADGRLVSVLLHLSKVFEGHVKKMSVYLLNLPGFKSLSSDDRCAIVKERAQILSLAYDFYTRPDGSEEGLQEDLFVTELDGKLEVVTFEMLTMLQPEELIRGIFSLRRKWGELNLTTKEDALFMAIISVYEPGSSVSEEGKLKCYALHACFMLCLRKVLARRRNPSEVNEKMEKITSFIKYSVEFSTIMLKYSAELAMVYEPFFTKMAKLTFEVLRE